MVVVVTPFAVTEVSLTMVFDEDVELVPPPEPEADWEASDVDWEDVVALVPVDDDVVDVDDDDALSCVAVPLVAASVVPN